MRVFKGLNTSPGVAVGPVVKIDRGAAGLHRFVCDPTRERALYEAAIILAKDELWRLRQKAQGPEADIFVFQIALLEDESFTTEIGDYIAAGAGSAEAVERAEQIFAARLDNVDDPYIRERSVDVRDACRRVVDILDGRPRQKVDLTTPSILAADIFYPSDILCVDRAMILGIASDADSNTSHAVIMARTMGIPAVCRLGKGMADAADGKTAILDGVSGVFTIDPTPEEIAKAERKSKTLVRRSKRKSDLADKPCLTKDGTPFTLWVNGVDPTDIRKAMEAGAAGVGLVRSEMLLMRERSEENQYQHYVSCLGAADGAPVTVRTFDVGDATGMIDSNEEFSLDERGIRIMDTHRDLFDVQLCALLRAGLAGDLRVMLPMVGGPEDWINCMKEVEHCKDLLRRRKVPFAEDMPFGCLIEIPAAALAVDEILMNGASFLMIGTNDLVQYTCAAYRSEKGGGSYYRVGCTGVRRLIGMVKDAAAAYHVPLYLAGASLEAPGMVEGYMRGGLTCFSMEASSLNSIKARLLELDLSAPPAEPAPAKKAKEA